MAATQLLFDRQGFVSATGTRSADLIDKTMDLYLERAEKQVVDLGKYFQTLKADNTTLSVTSVGGELNLPRIAYDSDPQNFDTPAPGYSKTYTIKLYRNGIRIEKLLTMVDRSGKIPMIIGGLPASFRKFYGYGMANVIETAAATAGADGSFGFAADHYLEGAGAGQWDNLESASALTTTTLNTMAVGMANRKDANGFVMGITMKELLVPNALREKAFQVCKSDQVAESNVNAINVYTSIVPVVSPYLTASSTAYYGIGDLPEAQWGAHVVELEKPTITRLGYPSVDYPLIAAGYEGHCRVAFGFSQLKNMHYSAGA